MLFIQVDKKHFALYIGTIIDMTVVFSISPTCEKNKIE